MRVDFHCHSTASDGTCAPRALAEQARADGFRALALTDHDNCDGVRELLAAADAARACGTALVPGIELSIDPGKGFNRFHLLGLGIDPGNAALKVFLRKILDGRNARNARIIANFSRLGIELGADIQSYAHGEVLARPHFARWLVDHGYAASVKEAFDRYLADDAPAATRCYEERFHPSQEEAFRVVHGAGGLCVMAHPKYWRRSWKDVGVAYADAARELARLKEAGLDGIEALYQANTPEENVEFTRIADKLGYLKTAGSDFHGSNKPTIALGMEVSETYIAPFLEALDLVY